MSLKKKGACVRRLTVIGIFDSATIALMDVTAAFTDGSKYTATSSLNPRASYRYSTKKPSVEVATYPDNFSLPPRIPNCRSLSSVEPNCKEHVSSFPLNVFFVASSNFSHICSMASLVPYFEPESFSDCSVR